VGWGWGLGLKVREVRAGEGRGGEGKGSSPGRAVGAPAERVCVGGGARLEARGEASARLPAQHPHSLVWKGHSLMMCCDAAAGMRTHASSGGPGPFTIHTAA
jgi:hypothetical protein